MKPEFRLVRRTIYALKRTYPQSVTLCRTSSNSTDLTTGRQTAVTTELHIRRAVLLPTKESRKFSYDLSFIAANRNFTYGALYDHRIRVLLIDRRDARTWLWDLNMYVMFSGKRWEVKEICEYEEEECVVLVLDALRGAPGPSVQQNVNQQTGLSGNATGSVA